MIVIGGGDTAMDCVRTAIRQGAASVTCLYRRDRENMPGSLREVTHAEEEGVVFEWLSAPLALKGDATTLSGVRVQRMGLGAPDADGRRQPMVLEGAETDLDGDLVIAALGYEAEGLDDLAGIHCTPRGTIRVTERCRTSLPGVYAGGDIVRGASLVVRAIKDGQDAAATIHADLMARVEAAQTRELEPAE